MKYKLLERSSHKNTTIRLTFDGGGWANMTFVQMKSNWTNVVISSDWGHWEHGWSNTGFGSDQTIPEAMVSKMNKGYFQNKFIGPEKKVFSPEKTCTRFRKIVREECPWIKDRGTHEDHMGVIKELQSIDDDRDFIDRLHEYEDLRELLGDDYWTLLEYETRGCTRSFFKEIYPKVKNKLAAKNYSLSRIPDLFSYLS